jgi:intracellular multiplication protein IcmO
MNLYVTDQGAVRHETVIGKSGSGKTNYLLHRLRQQMKRGGGAFILDSKTDYDFRDELWDLGHCCGREMDLRCVNIDNAAESHTYNPLLRGDAIAVASRFTDTVDVGNNPTAEHFKAQGNLALTAALTPVKSLQAAYNAKDLYILLSNPEAMGWLLRQLPPGEARQSFDIWLESYRHWDNVQKATRINTSVLRQQIGGIVARLYIYSVGEIGKVMNSYNPEVDLLNAIDNHHIVYFMIPSLDKSEASIAFAKLFFSDFRSTLAALYRRPKWQRPRIPHESYLDEFGSYTNRLVPQTFEMGRGAQCAMIPMFQTYANLKLVSEDFADQIIGNTEIQTFLTIGDPNTAEFAAKTTGEILRKFKMESRGESHSSGNKNLQLEVFHSLGKTSSESVTLREQYDYRIRADEFRDLDVGEAFVFVKGAKSGYKVKLPLCEAPASGGFRLRRFETKERAGLNLATKFDTEFSSSFVHAAH